MIDLHALMDDAREHCLWAAAEGFSPRDVIESVNLDWCTWKAPTWSDAQSAIQAAKNGLARKNV